MNPFAVLKYLKFVLPEKADVVDLVQNFRVSHLISFPLAGFGSCPGVWVLFGKKYYILNKNQIGV